MITLYIILPLYRSGSCDVLMAMGLVPLKSHRVSHNLCVGAWTSIWKGANGEMRPDKIVSDLNYVVFVVKSESQKFLFPPTLLISAVSYVLITRLFPCCSTERVQPPACGSQVRQDGSGQPPPAEESLARCCRKGKKGRNGKARAPSSQTRRQCPRNSEL